MPRRHLWHRLASVVLTVLSILSTGWPRSNPCGLGIIMSVWVRTALRNLALAALQLQRFTLYPVDRARRSRFRAVLVVLIALVVLMVLVVPTVPVVLVVPVALVIPAVPVVSTVLMSPRWS